MTSIRVGHLYPDYLNIYADRGNIAVLARRAAWRGHELVVTELEPGMRRTIAGFENHAGRTRLDPGAEPLGRVVAGFGNDGESGYEGCRLGRAIGTYLHGPLLPRNPWLADWLLAQALAHRTGGDPPDLAPLPDALEARAHDVSAARARSRGGKS